MDAWASGPRRARWFEQVFAAATILRGTAPPGSSADVDDVRPLFIKGEYARCIKACQEAIAEREPEEAWRLLLAESLMAVGRYTNALAVVETNLTRFPWSVQLRLLAHDVFRRNGKAEEAASALDEVNQLGGRRMWAYQDTANLVTMGRAAILLGADPRRVLEQFFDLAKKRDATNRIIYLASGQL